MAGVASRRAAEELIVQGRVEVNGETIRALGTKADPTTDTIKVDGRRLKFDRRPRYILLNKPKNIVTTRKDPEGRRTVIDLLKGVREYVYPVGRLDYDSEGLLLLTSDGDLAAQLTHPRHAVERVYDAVVVGVPEEDALEKLRRGIFLDGTRTSSAQLRRVGSIGKGRQELSRITVILLEGRNRQIRRMFASIGHPVKKLMRMRMGPVKLGDLPPGHWRDLTVAEVAKLKSAVGSTTAAKEATSARETTEAKPRRG